MNKHMPRKKLPKGYKAKESTFFTMKANPKGASVGNFVNNMKTLASPVTKAAKGASKVYKETYKNNVARDKALGLDDPISKVSAGIKGVLNVGVQGIKSIPKPKPIEKRKRSRIERYY